MGQPRERGEDRAILFLWGERRLSQPTIHPASQQKNHPAKKKKRHVATWIALASAGAAIVAAGVSAFQVSIAKQQNAVAEQEQLVSLTASIAQQQTTVTQAAGNLTGAARTAAESNATLGLVATLTVEGQAAAVLINSLHGDGVAGIEYVQVARALASSGDTGQAITFYKDAVDAPPHDVVTRANALRNEAALYYGLGQNVIAHQDMIRAATIYRGHVELTKSLIDNSIAQAYLGDAEFQLLIKGCHIAAADLGAALHAVAPLGPGGSSTTVQALQAAATVSYQSKCASNP